MSANTWMIIGIVGFVLSAIFLIVSILLFIKLNILSVIGDLSGRTIAKELQNIRENNMASGNKRFKPSPLNLSRGMLTEKVEDTPVRQLSEKEIAVAHASQRLDLTADISSVHPHSVTDNLVSEPEQTMQLEKESATEVLSDETEILSDFTEVLSSEIIVINEEGTTVLGQTQELKEEFQAVSFKMLRSIVETHTDEEIN